MSASQRTTDRSPLPLHALNAGEAPSNGRQPHSAGVVLKRLCWWWHYGMFFDYLVIVAVVGVSFAVDNAGPFIRPFDPNDAELSHPHVPNIVSNANLAIFSVLCPIIVATIDVIVRCLLGRYVMGRRGASNAGTTDMSDYSSVLGGTEQDAESDAPNTQRRAPWVNSFATSLREWHHFVVGLLLSVTFTKLATDAIKVQAGRLRPDFLSRCQYSQQIKACTGDEGLVIDGRKSFPSGHASLSFAGCTFLTIYLLASLKVWPVVTAAFTGPIIQIAQGGAAQRRKVAYTSAYPVSGRAWRFVVALAPLFGSTYIGISRTQQYVHFPTDVIAGSILGILVAICVHYSRVPASWDTDFGHDEGEVYHHLDE